MVQQLRGLRCYHALQSQSSRSASAPLTSHWIWSDLSALQVSLRRYVSWWVYSPGSCKYFGRSSNMFLEWKTELFITSWQIEWNINSHKLDCQVKSFHHSESSHSLILTMPILLILQRLDFVAEINTRVHFLLAITIVENLWLGLPGRKTRCTIISL